MEPAGKDEESENACDNLENSCQTFMAYIRGLTKLLAATKVWKKVSKQQVEYIWETFLVYLLLSFLFFSHFGS